MAQVTDDKPNTDAAGDATPATVESNLPDTERNEDLGDKDRAKIAKDTELEAVREVHGNDVKNIRELNLDREGVLATSLSEATKAQMDDAIYNVIRVLDAAGDAADKNADLRKVKEALARGLGADIPFLV